MRASWHSAGLSSLALLAVACASAPGPPFDERFIADLDRNPVPTPSSPVRSDLWDRIDDRVPHTVYRLIDVPAHIRNLGHWLGLNDRREAANVNAWDEVPDSTWFTNRILKAPMAWDELLRAAETGPSSVPYWTVIAAKEAGITPGFVIRDVEGDIYFVKFDPPGYDGLSSGAEVVSSLILHAAGYNVPVNTVHFVEPGQFRLGQGAKIPGEYGVKRPMHEEDLRKILGRLNLRADGRVRVLASKGLPGRPIGPFEYEGTRHDDLNDRIPHEDRRELRGYMLLSAWLNNTDILPKNTLDMYVGEPGAGHVVHNVLDFGSALGAGGDGPKARRAGHEHYVDYEVAMLNVVTLGLRTPDWEDDKPSPFLSIGFFGAADFDPLSWSPRYANPTLKAVTDRDAFWATRIIMRFSDQDLLNIARAARYPEAGAADYVAVTLAERRDAFGRIWLRRLTPVDDVVLSPGNVLSMVDLAVATGIDPAAERRVHLTVAEYAASESVPADGRLSWALSSHLRQGHNPVLVDIVQDDQPVGKGVRIGIYCAAEECVVTGIER